jgi:hypothetical protein
VPTFYFDVCADRIFVRDRDGVDLPDMKAVEREAADLAITIGRETFCTGHGRKVAIRVRSTDGVHILTASISLELLDVPPTDGRAS